MISRFFSPLFGKLWKSFFVLCSLAFENKLKLQKVVLGEKHLLEIWKVAKNLSSS